MLRRVLLVLVGVLLVGVLGAGPALAVGSHAFSASFGSPGPNAGELSGPSGVAVNSTTHDVYVADTGNARVDEFEADGTFVRAWGWGVGGGSGFEACTLICQKGLSGAGAGEFQAPTFIAVDNDPGSASFGDVYVGDTGTGLVTKFTGSGALVSGWGDRVPADGQLEGKVGAEGPFNGPFSVSGGTVAGVAVDMSGNLWVDTSHSENMFEFDQGGKFVREWPLTDGQSTESGLAVDSAQNLYFVGGYENIVQYTSGGGLMNGGVTPAPFLNNTDGGYLPSGLAVDQVSSDLYIDDEGHSIKHLAPSCAAGGSCEPVESFGTGQLSGGAGLAVDSGSGTVYAADKTAGVVDAFVQVIEANTGVASNITATTATVSGMVNPDGSPVGECYFEYGTESTYGQSARCEETVGGGTGAVEVHADLKELQGGTTYHFRLVAVDGKGTARGEDAEFPTLPVPVIVAAAAKHLSAEGVDLTAVIDPRELATEYHFEWGASTAYGTKVPVPDGSIAAMAGEVPVEAHVSELHANVTYHWRVVVHDVNGTTTGVDHTFVYDTSGAGLPDGRAYEMVTPPSKNASLLSGQSVEPQEPDIAEDGSRLMAPILDCFGDAQACIVHRSFQWGEAYSFTRTSGGWVANALAPAASQYDQNTSWLFSAETGSALFSMPTAPFGEEDWYARGADGAFADIGPFSQPSLGYRETFPKVVATADLSHIVFTSYEYRWPFDATNNAPDVDTLYEYVGVGNTQPSLVGVSGGPGSTELISTCQTHLAGGLSSRREYGALSADGRIVYFVADACTAGFSGKAPPVNELYARVEQARTVGISQRSPTECTGECAGSAPRAAEFQGASSDGSKAFFTSPQQLINGASEDSTSSDAGENCPGTAGASGCNLYEYDFDNPAGHNLVLVSAADGSVGGPRVAGGPRVQNVMALSSDGSHVYFVAKGVLTNVANDGGGTARDGAENLYVFERDATYPQGHVAFIAALSPSTEGQDADSRQWAEGVGYANVTPDGRFLVFTSHLALTADDTRPEGPGQVYRYDAVTGQLVRISIGNDGFNDNGNGGVGDAGIRPPFYGWHVRAGAERPDPTMSNDGSFVFFTSPVALVPGALDDVEVPRVDGRSALAQNVYEWHEGHVYLISDGRDATLSAGASSVQLLGSDASGANVFFTTADPLVAQDTDTQTDIYDARICTASEPCIPSSPPVVSCQGEACHGTPGGAPSLSVPASATFSGAGNPVSVAAKPAVKPKKKAKKKAKPKPRKPRKPRRRAKTRRAVGSRVHVKRGRK